MVRIDCRSSNLPITESLAEHIHRRLDFALRRFGTRVEGLTVRLVDINGPKGGPDKRCRILARLSSSKSVMVEATDSDVYAAVSHAATRLDEGVSRAVRRFRERPLSRRRKVSGPVLARAPLAGEKA